MFRTLGIPPDESLYKSKIEEHTVLCGDEQLLLAVQLVVLDRSEGSMGSMTRFRNRWGESEEVLDAVR